MTTPAHLSGFAKIAPWRLAHRDSSLAKEPGQVAGRAAPPPLSAHTSEPLGLIAVRFKDVIILDKFFFKILDMLPN